MILAVGHLQNVPNLLCWRCCKQSVEIEIARGLLIHWLYINLILLLSRNGYSNSYTFRSEDKEIRIKKKKEEGIAPQMLAHQLGLFTFAKHWRSTLTTWKKKQTHRASSLQTIATLYFCDTTRNHWNNLFLISSGDFIAYPQHLHLHFSVKSCWYILAGLFLWYLCYFKLNGTHGVSTLLSNIGNFFLLLPFIILQGF